MGRFCVILLFLSFACGDDDGVDVDAGPPGVDTGPAPAPSAPAPAAPTPPPAPEPPVRRAPVAGEQVDVAAGAYRIGTAPGTLGRVPRDEADLVELEVPAFTIDRLPYPNDPAASPRTGVTQHEASALCEARGQHLCSEVEWELACTGGEPGRVFATGETFDPTCPEGCESPSGTQRMGGPIGEWTSNRGSRGLSSDSAVFRGAAAGGELTRHRCGARRSTSPLTRSPNLGFRCCGPTTDAPAALAYPTERGAPRFRPGDPDEARGLLARVPAFAERAAGAHLYDAEAMMRAVSDPAILRGWEIAGPVLEWSPTEGERMLVLSGRLDGDAFLAVLHPMPDGSVHHVGGLVLEGEPGPIAVAFTPPSTDEILFSAKWGEAGEGGAIVWSAEEGRASLVWR